MYCSIQFWSAAGCLCLIDPNGIAREFCLNLHVLGKGGIYLSLNFCKILRGAMFWISSCFKKEAKIQKNARYTRQLSSFHHTSKIVPICNKAPGFVLCDRIAFPSISARCLSSTPLSRRSPANDVERFKRVYRKIAEYCRFVNLCISMWNYPKRYIPKKQHWNEDYF